MAAPRCTIITERRGSGLRVRRARPNLSPVVRRPKTPSAIEPRIVADLIRRFEASPVFADMADTTKKEYRRKFTVIERKWGTAPIAAFNDKEFRKDALDWRDEIANRTRREADNLMSALARLGSWAFDRGEVDRNVLDDFPRVYHSDRTDKLWLPAHVDAFLRVASVEMKVALMLGMHTGQRQADLRRMTWSGYDGERITLRQSKGKKVVSIKCTNALKTMLDGMEKKGVVLDQALL